MTLPEFLHSFRIALRGTEARLMFHAPHLYPSGELIRLHIVPPQGTTLPPATDPVGLVWFHQKGELRGILESVEVGIKLGLDMPTAVAICQAADGSFAARDLPPKVLELRGELITILDDEGLSNQSR